MTTVVTADSGKAMGKVTTLQELFNNLTNNRPPESIFTLIALIIYPYKFLKVVSNILIKRALKGVSGMIYAGDFIHFFCVNREMGKANGQHALPTKRVTYVILYVKKKG